MSNRQVIFVTCCVLAFNALFIDLTVPASIDTDRGVINPVLNSDDVEFSTDSSSSAENDENISPERLILPQFDPTSAVNDEDTSVNDASRPFRRVDRHRFRSYRGDLGKRSTVGTTANDWDAGQLAELLMLHSDDVKRRMRLRGDLGKRRSKFRGDLGRRRSWSSPCVIDQLQEGTSALDCNRLESGQL